MNRFRRLQPHRLELFPHYESLFCHQFQEVRSKPFHRHPLHSLELDLY